MDDKNMNVDMLRPPRPHCPCFDVNGLIANGKQFDLDITLPEDSRDVVFGTIKNVFKEPIKDAVVKLIEIDFGNDVRHYNMEFKGHHEGKCLKGMPGEKCECEIDEGPCRG